MSFTKRLPAVIGLMSATAMLGACSLFQPGHGPRHSGYAPSAHQYAPHPGYYGAKQHGPGYTYGSIGAVMHDVDDSGYGVQGRLGYQMGNVLGAEVEGATSVTDSGTAPSVDYQIAGFGTAKMPITPRMSFRARGGYHLTDLSGPSNEEGFAYGAGLEYALSPRDALRFDYTNYEIDGASNLDSLSIGYQRRF